ncbi:MAG: hypothetical protein JXR50_00520 [Prolixibacteraceae bacterium]|nr:hypothetical protein [Prolixibacteraceae bacterium]MBN2648204.1 hypothetical protein [Prolixibacteraceae bacterium]
MEKAKMLKYIFSIATLLVAFTTFAQKPDRHQLLLGVDLSRFVVPILDSTRFGWEVSADYELLNDMYVNVEIGSQNTRFKTAGYHYNAAGAYTRLGVDYNFMKHVDEESTDKLLVGFRYGFSTFYHEADQITLSDEIWGELSNQEVERNWLTANWVEATTGMRARLINNFYMGWTIRFRVRLWLQKDKIMEPYHIPGYGRAWNNSWVGVNYSLYYQIPLFKKKSQIPGEK